MAYLGRKAALAGLTSSDIPDNSITSAKIVDGAVAVADLGPDSVDSSELVDGSIDTSHIGDDQVTGDKLANDIAISTTGAITTTGAFTSVGIDDNASGATAITIDSTEMVTITRAGASDDNKATLKVEPTGSYGVGLHVYSNADNDSNPLCDIHSDNASMNMPALRVTQDGTGDILQVKDGASNAFRVVADGGVELTGPIRMEGETTTFQTWNTGEPKWHWETQFDGGWCYRFHSTYGSDCDIYMCHQDTHGMALNVKNGASASTYLLNINNGSTNAFRVWGDGQVDVNGSQVHAGSDERLKKNITTITNGLARVNNMRGVRFQWKESEDQRYAEQVDIVTKETIPATPEYQKYHFGLIAQEVEEENPELVVDRHDGMKMIMDGNQLDAIIIEAVKELTTRVVALENA